MVSYATEGLEKRARKWAEKNLPGTPLIQCDVSKDEEIARCFEQVREQWDALDFVVHSVAFADREDLKGRFADTGRDGFHLALDVSAYSLVPIAREASAMMPGGGSIVAMTYYGAEKVVPRYNVMGVAKAALECSARYLAFDLGGSGIRVNCISAGPLKTLSAMGISGFSSMLDVIEGTAPLQRNIEQQDVGEAALYLVSDLSKNVTGEVIHVDAGYHVMGMSRPKEEQG